MGAFHTWAVGAAMLAACGFSDPAAAQQGQPFPNRPLRLVVPFPPGGASDIIGRVVGQKLGERLGQTVVVENKPGAASTIGIADAARAAPDGYTLLLAAAPFVITQYVYPNLPYDGRKDFQPLVLMVTSPMMIAAHPSLGMKTPEDLLAQARERPGRITFASPGTGSLPHLAGELFKLQANVNMVHVPYKGGGPAVVDLVAGHVNTLWASPLEVMPHVQSGKLSLLASTAAKRTTAFPDVPVLAEKALPGYEAFAWFGLVTRAGTPAPILERLSTELQAVLKMPEVIEKIGQGGDVVGGSPKDFERFIESEHSRWGRTVKAADIKPN
jgi:tripartite-type tricarboxylate transporter receptor subunit TctC